MRHPIYSAWNKFRRYSSIKQVARRVNAYLDSLGGWTLDVRFNEVAGGAISYGLDSTAGLVSGCIQGVAGKLGAREAYSYDGVDDAVVFSNASVTNTKTLSTRRCVFLINATSLGEGSTGAFFSWGDSTTVLRFEGGNRLVATIDGTATDSAAITNNNQFTNFGSWVLVFTDYDDANELGLGRRIRLIVATETTPATLLTLGTNIALAGTVVTPVADLYLGNRASGDRTFLGLQDFTRMGNGLWSPAGTPLDLTRAELLRQKVFGV